MFDVVYETLFSEPKVLVLRLLLADGPRIQDLAERWQKTVSDPYTLALGELVRLGVAQGNLAVLAGPLFSAVRKSWPQIRLHLTEGSSAQLEEWLTQGRLDLALLLREEDTAAPEETVLMRLPLYLVVPAKDPLAGRKTIDFDDVAGLPLVLPSEPHPLRARLAMLARQKGLTLMQVLEADSIRLQHEITASGGGYAITAGTLTANEARRLAAVRIVRPALSRAVVLGVTRHRAHTKATWEVMRLLKSMAPAMLKSARQN